jgi:hypothetical protein
MATNRLEANWADRFVSAVEIAFVWEEASLGFSHIGPQFKLQPFGSGVSSLLSLQARGITISDDCSKGNAVRQTLPTPSVIPNVADIAPHLPSLHLFCWIWSQQADRQL